MLSSLMRTDVLPSKMGWFKIRFRWARRGILIELSEWCNQHESIGQYEYQYSDTVFWFEKEADAMWFKLAWADVLE